MINRYIALTLMTLAFGAQAATSQPKEAPADSGLSAVASPVVSPAPVKVTGATTVAGSAPLLSLDGQKAVEPSFQELFNTVKANASWKITTLKDQGKAYRATMASTTGKATLEMDVARDMALSLKLKSGDTIDVVTQVMGLDALIKFTKDKVPLGFMVNKLEPAKP